MERRTRKQSAEFQLSDAILFFIDSLRFCVMWVVFTDLRKVNNSYPRRCMNFVVIEVRNIKPFPIVFTNFYVV
jgi:hypothetical protein